MITCYVSWFGHDPLLKGSLWSLLAAHRTIRSRPPIGGRTFSKKKMNDLIDPSAWHNSQIHCSHTRNSGCAGDSHNRPSSQLLTLPQLCHGGLHLPQHARPRYWGGLWCDGPPHLSCPTWPVSRCSSRTLRIRNPVYRWSSETIWDQSFHHASPDRSQACPGQTTRMAWTTSHA